MTALKADYGPRFDAALESDEPLTAVGGLLTGVQALGDFNRMLPRLAERAPEEIREDMEELARLSQEQPQLSGTGFGDVMTALANGVMGGLMAGGPIERVDAYAQQECGVQVFGVMAAPSPDNGSGAVKAELKNAAIAEESYYTGHSTYTTSVTQLEQEGFSPNPDVVTVIERADQEAYCITASHRETGESFSLSSESGMITPGTCP